MHPRLVCIRCCCICRLVMHYMLYCRRHCCRLPACGAHCVGVACSTGAAVGHWKPNLQVGTVGPVATAARILPATALEAVAVVVWAAVAAFDAGVTRRRYLRMVLILLEILLQPFCRPWISRTMHIATEGLQTAFKRRQNWLGQPNRGLCRQSESRVGPPVCFTVVLCIAALRESIVPTVLHLVTFW